MREAIAFGCWRAILPKLRLSWVPRSRWLPEISPKPNTLPAALRDVDHIIFTAGAPSGRYAPESLIKATDYQGVVDTLAAAQSTGCRGRFVYLNTLGIMTPSLPGIPDQSSQENTLIWRRRVEDNIRGSGLDYTIIRVGFLLDRPGGEHAVNVSQAPCPGVSKPHCPRRCRRSVCRGDAASERVTRDIRNRLGQRRAAGELEQPA